MSYVNLIGAHIASVNAAIESLHPHLAGADVIQLACVLVLSALGARAITGPEQRSERSLADVRAIVARAKTRHQRR